MRGEMTVTTTSAGDDEPTRSGSISLCMIVKNEESNLPDCLRSVAGLVDEIVIVDTGSLDATRDHALAAGAKVYEFPWVDDFAAARNETLKHASGEWVFWMDADDRIDEANRQKFLSLRQKLQADVVGYVMKCVCLPDPQNQTATVVDHVRLFRNHPAVRWRYRVHEQILPALRQLGGRIEWSDVAVQHVGYQDRALRRRKLERDIRLLGLENDEHPDDPFTLFNLGSVYQELGDYEKAIAHLQRSLQRSQLRDSIVRKLFSLIAQCQRQLGRQHEALAVCQEGRKHYPDDVELLFQESLTRREKGDLLGAEQCLLHVLGNREQEHFASVDAGLRGFKTRHNLAVICQDLKRWADAEEHWQKAVEERQDYLPGWIGMAEARLMQEKWDVFEAALKGVERLSTRLEADVLRARKLIVQKDYGAARSQLESLIAKYPAERTPKVILSHALLMEGNDPTAAEKLLRKLLEEKPDDAEARHNLSILLKRREGSSAPGTYLSPETVTGGSSEQLVNEGVALAQQGKLDHAIELFRRAVQSAPANPKAHHNLGVALAQKNQSEDAVASIREALRLFPEYSEAHYNLGNVLNQLGRADQAIASFRRAIELKPEYPEALNNLGLALVFQRKPGPALVYLKQAVRLRENFAEAFNNLGLALTDLGDFRAAEECFDKVLRLNPRHADGHSNLGNSYKERGRLEEALTCYETAIALEPRAVSPHWNRALALLLAGDYERGWAEYEWRRQRPENAIRPFPQPAWDGGDLRGRTLLVHGEQGMGDMLQFVRYGALAEAGGGRVVLACPETLLHLFKRTPGFDEVVDERGPLPHFDVHAPLMSLPFLLKSTLPTIPADVPYLFCAPELLETWREKLATLGPLKIGLCWQGNPRHKRDRERSIPLHRFAPLASIPGARFVSLQRTHGLDQGGRHGLRLHEPEGLQQEDWTFSDTAAVIKSLDLVITVDTAIAHLAGGLGVPTWILLPTAPDWRWLLDQTDSPWYPTARLFRQRRWGDWEEVLERVAECLLPLTEGKRPGRERKLGTWDELLAWRAGLRREGKSVVWTNGCFDLLHEGHVRSLEAARALGHALVVGVNSDASVTRLKGPGRPLIPSSERAALLTALECVDRVIVFNEDTPTEALQRLRPDIHCKGADYCNKLLPEAEAVQAYGGRVVFLPLFEGLSTTALIERATRVGVKTEVNGSP